jgi:hypothetical protein
MTIGSSMMIPFCFNLPWQLTTKGFENDNLQA